MIKAKVKKKSAKDVPTAKMGPIGGSMTAAEPMFTKPTLAQQIQMREMVTAKMMAAQPVPSAEMAGAGQVPSAEMSAGKVRVKPKAMSRDADIYDERIGGYGKSMGPQESGEQAVQRIMKSKVKRKKVM